MEQAKDIWGFSRHRHRGYSIGLCVYRFLYELEDRRPARSGKGRCRQESTKYRDGARRSGFWIGKTAGRKRGLDKIFIEAGLEWYELGCSMCLAMNADQLEVGKHASTSNRNFEGRQDLVAARIWSARPWRPRRQFMATLLM